MRSKANNPTPLASLFGFYRNRDLKMTAAALHEGSFLQKFAP